MQIKGKYSWVKHLDFMTIDMLSLLLSFFLSYFIKFHRFAINEDWGRFIVIILLLNLSIYMVASPYSGIFKRRYYHEIGRSMLFSVANALCATLFFYVLKIGAEYSREVFIYTYLLYYVISVTLKYIWKKLLVHRLIRSRNAKNTALFLICEKKNARKDIRSVYASDLQLYDVCGVHFVGQDEEKSGGHSVFKCKIGKETKQIPVIRSGYLQYILDNNISEVMVAAQPSAVTSDVYQALIANGIGVNLVVEALLGVQTEQQFVANIGVNKALSVRTFSFSPSQSFYLMLKRLFDICCGLVGVLVLIPVTALVKLAYLASGDTSRIFYQQSRVGQNGNAIRIWKFRSMVPNAGEALEELLKDESYRREWEANQKLENDPRITKVGAVLRKTSVDELPQLINVLRGDMSLVGPRPLVAGELEAHDGLKLYQKVKPGITGWWGCNGRSNIDYHERLELEYYYVKNCSLYLDLLCIIRTVFAVLEKDGAV